MCNEQYAIIGSDNDLARTDTIVILWTEFDLDSWRIYVSFKIIELTQNFRDELNTFDKT